MHERRTKIFTGEDGKDYTLKYHIVQSIASFEGEEILCYGIRIEKYFSDKLLECSEIPNITSKAIEINMLFMLLFEHTVTPACLRDVVDDFLLS